MMADLPQAKWMAEQIRNNESGEAPVRVNDAEALFPAVEHGLGKSLLPKMLADAEPGLSLLSDPSPPVTREIWLLVHPELRELRRIQVVSDWLVDTFRDFQDMASAPGIRRS
jgi:DNA-binding transcriptional LysR family regulator